MIRVSAGLFKGVFLDAPKGIRPTGSKVRQALFNILANAIPNARVLDVFAGSGALGIEALSRGAAFVAFIEQDPECVMAIRDNLLKCGSELPRSAFRVVQADMAQGLRLLDPAEAPFDLVLMDPPYRMEDPIKALQAVGGCAIIATAGFLAIEHERRTPLPEEAGRLRRIKQHRYGQTVLSFYQAASITPAQAH